MSVEQVEQTDDEVIELYANAERKAIMDGTEPPVIEEKEAETEPETEVVEEVKPAATLENPNELKDRIFKLEKALDTTNGRYGQELHRLKTELAEVKQQRQQVISSITPAQLKRISVDYPEFAEALAGDLTEAFAPKEKEAEKSYAKPVEVQEDPRIATIQESVDRMAEQTRQVAIRELNREHPDWREIALFKPEEVPGIGSVIKWEDPNFGAWVGKQDAQTQDAVYNSTDIGQIAKILTAYKESGKVAEPTKKVDPQEKLKKALLPTGKKVGTHEALTDEEIVEQAMRAERKRIMTGAY